MLGSIPYMFDCCGNLAVHLLLLKSIHVYTLQIIRERMKTTYVPRTYLPT